MPARAENVAELERRLLADLDRLGAIPEVPAVLLGKLELRIRLLVGTARCAEQEASDLGRRCHALRGKVRGLEQDRCERTLAPPQPN